MEDLSLIMTLAGSLGAALVCGYITLRLGLSPILGYLMAGLVVGPYTPGFTADGRLANQFADVGVILLMFGVGLQFHVEELLAVRRVAIPGAVGLSLAATVLGAFVGVAYGWGWPAGIVFGLALSVASTVILTRVMAESGDLQTKAGHIAIGWRVVEDLLTVLVLVLMPAVFAREVGGWGLVLAVVLALGKVAVMVGLTFLLGNRLIPWVLDRVAQTRSRELFTLTVLAIALGIAVGSVELFDVSVALGAFLAGMVVGRTEFSLRAATEALPMRDAFAVLFFVSVGMLFRPKFLLESPGLVAWTVAVVMLAKPLAAFAVVAPFGLPLRTAVSVSLVAGQIGEFSFILATVGEHLGVIDERARNAIVAAAIASIAANPLIYRLVDPMTRLLGRMLKRPAPDGVPTRLGAEGAAGDRDGEVDGPSGARFRSVIVGYGPVGRTLARLLRENRVEPVIVELNVETVRRLNADGTTAIYGDAARRETLESAGVPDAVALVIGSSTMQGTAETIRHARELNPSILIFARSAYLREVEGLREAGADVVFSGEGEVALSMTESLLRHLRATPEQVDRERARIRAELLAGLPDPDSIIEGRELPAARDGEGEHAAASEAR
ncbi:Inner membrane protein YbaL [Aquisphaera giovannonii]|uniref:Inner membrane protein YbaL n=1 Tax=Aquisphaera giovannonii TaxID=406548 RepID=A0A5B9VXF4_9BACT|nr:cation:proton antiporter [Aquisphaera giovannonii]QEH32455.1 Inner membrane protein YbaL [Aquisphaera giovannonii]